MVDNKKVKSIDFEVLITNGLANKNDKVKILGRGEFKSKIEVKAHAFSETAKKAIESAGGTAVTI